MPSVPRAVTEDLGYARAYQEWFPGAQPAAGANYTLSIPGQFATRLLAVTFRLVCDANAANRVVTVDYLDGAGNTYASAGAAAVITAGQTQDYFGSLDHGTSEWNTNTPVFFPLIDALLMPGRQLQITVANKQAGDQLSRIFKIWERYPTGPRGYDEAEYTPRSFRGRH